MTPSPTSRAPMLTEPQWMNLIHSMNALLNDPGEERGLLTQHARLVLLDALALYWEYPEAKALHSIVLSDCSKWEIDQGY